MEKNRQACIFFYILSLSRLHQTTAFKNKLFFFFYQTGYYRAWFVLGSKAEHQKHAPARNPHRIENDLTSVSLCFTPCMLFLRGYLGIKGCKITFRCHVLTQSQGWMYGSREQKGSREIRIILIIVWLLMEKLNVFIKFSWSSIDISKKLPKSNGFLKSVTWQKICF